MMKFFDYHSNINKLEESVRNLFKWEWLEHKDSNNDVLNKWYKKIDSACESYCVSCNSVLKCGTEGFKAFSNHAKTAVHIKNSK